MRAIADPSDRNPFRRSQQNAVVRKIFEAESNLIVTGWLRRRVQFQNLPPKRQALLESPDDWMQRCTYRLVKYLVARKREEILTKLVDEIPQRHGSRHSIDAQPFKKALLVMFWRNPCPTSAPLLDRRRRAELGDAMAYAREHRVPSKYFNGFIKQAGIKRIAGKLKTGFREPGFPVATDGETGA